MDDSEEVEYPLLDSRSLALPGSSSSDDADEIVVDGSPSCTFHPDVASTGQCGLCSRPTCSDCERTYTSYDEAGDSAGVSLPEFHEYCPECHEAATRRDFKRFRKDGCKKGLAIGAFFIFCTCGVGIAILAVVLPFVLIWWVWEELSLRCGWTYRPRQRWVAAAMSILAAVALGIAGAFSAFMTVSVSEGWWKWLLPLWNETDVGPI